LRSRANTAGRDKRTLTIGKGAAGKKFMAVILQASATLTVADSVTDVTAGNPTCDFCRKTTLRRLPAKLCWV
jgi:hypothetical protein